MKFSIEEVLSSHGALVIKTKETIELVGNARIVSVFNDSCRVFWHNPNTVTFAGVHIVLNYDHIPNSITDGVLVYSGEGEFYSIESIEGIFDDNLKTCTINFRDDAQTIYLSIFSFSTDGTISKEFVSLETIPIRGTFYGYHVDESNPSPTDSVTYIGANTNFDPARNTINYSETYGENGSFNLGGWANSFPFNAIKPCTLNSDGSFNKYVNPDDYTKHTDGSSTSGLNIFVEIPPIYFYIERESSLGYTVYIAQTQLNKNFRALAHERVGVLKGNLYVGVYQGTIETINDVSVLVSKNNGLATLDGTKRTIAQVRALAKANGEGFELYNYRTHALFAMLCVLLGKSLNVQKQLALGNCFSSSTMYENGYMDTKGMYYGDSNTWSRPSKLFGVEHLYGNYKTYLDGVYNDATNLRYYINDYSVENPTTLSEYKQYPITQNFTEKISGYYITKVAGNMNGLFLAMESKGGSSSTYYCDTVTNNYSNYNIATIGIQSDESEGVFRLYFYTGINSTNSSTGRLIYLAK